MSSLSLLGVAPQPSLRAQRAHAMKNCLAVVAAVLELVEGELGDAARRRLDRARGASDRLWRLLEDDLRLQRDAALDVDVEVAALLLEAVSCQQDLADARCLSLTCASAGGLIRGDAALLREALVNLIGNAIEATPPGGVIAVSSRLTDEGDQEWTIEDNGEGIAPDALGQIGQLHCTTRARGSGLGIAVAREAVWRHGGLLCYASTPAVGTTVTIWLPADHRLAT